MIRYRIIKERVDVGPESATKRKEEAGLWLAQLLIYSNKHLQGVRARNIFWWCSGSVFPSAPEQPLLLSHYSVPQGFWGYWMEETLDQLLLTHSAPPRKPYKDKIRCFCRVSCWTTSGTPLHRPWVRKKNICLLKFEIPLTRLEWGCLLSKIKDAKREDASVYRVKILVRICFR